MRPDCMSVSLVDVIRLCWLVSRRTASVRTKRAQCHWMTRQRPTHGNQCGVQTVGLRAWRHASRRNGSTRMNFRVSLVAAAIATVWASGASAAVVPKASMTLEPSSVIEVHARRDRERYDRNRHRRQQWVPGRRYDRPPPSWRRYGSRPRDWRRRGCVIVGPVWFCP
jgi:hypothetical protein